MRPLSVLLGASFLLGCGASAPASEGPRDGADVAARSDGCSPAETRLGSSCWSAAGTRWHIRADGPAGAYEFDVSLLAAGRVRAADHDGASPAADEWTQDGPVLRVFLADRFVEYRTRVTNGTVLIGEAVNVRGQRWTFRADRDFGDVVCGADEAQVPEGCLTVAGTRWELGEQTVSFLADGVLAAGAAEDATGRWSQRGATLSFQLADGEPNHVAEISSADQLDGTYEGAPGTWRASRVRLIPPVMRE